MEALIVKNLDVFIALFYLGFLMAIMQAIMTRDSFAWIDEHFKVRWFGKEAWTNKHTWKLFGKQGAFKYWPLIVFTDLFHLAHALFAFVLCAFISILTTATWLHLSILFFVYSASFELFYGKLFNNKNT